MLELDNLTLDPAAKLDVNNGIARFTNGGPLDDQPPQVAAGFTSRTWNGNGITSTAAHLDTSFLSCPGRGSKSALPMSK